MSYTFIIKYFLNSCEIRLIKTRNYWLTKMDPYKHRKRTTNNCQKYEYIF